MRLTILAALLGILICGCAGPGAVEQAANRCQQVGISERDPNFAACTQAYPLQREEGGLRDSIQQTANAGPRPRRALHCTDTGAC
jgi:hypothetical protein